MMRVEGFLNGAKALVRIGAPVALGCLGRGFTQNLGTSFGAGVIANLAGTIASATAIRLYVPYTRSGIERVVIAAIMAGFVGDGLRAASTKLVIGTLLGSALAAPISTFGESYFGEDFAVAALVGAQIIPAQGMAMLQESGAMKVVAAVCALPLSALTTLYVGSMFFGHRSSSS
jgi:hypothetical protein